MLKDFRPRWRCDVVGMSAPPPHIPSSWLQALDVTKRYNTSCSSHSISQHKCAGSFGVTPTAFCFISFFVMDISSLLPCPPPDPFITFLGELSPFSCGQHQSPWGLSYQRQPSLHITRLTRQQPKPGSFQRSRQPRAKPPATQWMDHLAVVSQGWKPHRHHFSVPKWQWILKGFVRPWRHD